MPPSNTNLAEMIESELDTIDPSDLISPKPSKQKAPAKSKAPKKTVTAETGASLSKEAKVIQKTRKPKRWHTNLADDVLEQKAAIMNQRMQTQAERFLHTRTLLHRLEGERAFRRGDEYNPLSGCPVSQATHVAATTAQQTLKK